jgi:hypothetical protein
MSRRPGKQIALEEKIPCFQPATRATLEFVDMLSR